MLDFLRDPVWQFFGFFVGLLAFVFGTWLSLRGRSRRLNYDVISKTPLLNYDLNSAKQRLQLLFNGKPIHNAELVLIKIHNAGSAPIKPDDYERPLKVVTGESSKILDAEVVDTHPKNLVVPISSIDNTSVIFKETLLNSGDYFVINTIVVPPVKISVDGRIAGIREIKSGAPKRYSQRIMITIFVWVVAIAMGTFISSGLTDYETPFVLAGYGFCAFFGGVILPRLMEWIRDVS